MEVGSPEGPLVHRTQAVRIDYDSLAALCRIAEVSGLAASWTAGAPLTRKTPGDCVASGTV